MEKRPADIITEARKLDRMRMEQAVLGSIGFGKKDINRFYENLSPFPTSALQELRA